MLLIFFLLTIFCEFNHLYQEQSCKLYRQNIINDYKKLGYAISTRRREHSEHYSIFQCRLINGLELEVLQRTQIRHGACWEQLDIDK